MSSVHFDRYQKGRTGLERWVGAGDAQRCYPTAKALKVKDDDGPITPVLVGGSRVLKRAVIVITDSVLTDVLLPFRTGAGDGSRGNEQLKTFLVIHVVKKSFVASEKYLISYLARSRVVKTVAVVGDAVVLRVAKVCALIGIREHHDKAACPRRHYAARLDAAAITCNELGPRSPVTGLKMP